MAPTFSEVEALLLGTESGTFFNHGPVDLFPLRFHLSCVAVFGEFLIRGR